MKAGVTYAFLAYVAWGLLPLYWHLLDQIPAEEILAYRIIWSFIFIVLIMIYQKKWQGLKQIFTQQKVLLYLLLSSLLISVNWFTYIWGITHDHVIETSIGYYINPLLSVLLGTLLLREKLNRLQTGSLILAAIGVGIFIFHFGQIPWIALILAASFAFYGWVKKVQQVAETEGLAIETFFVLPFALLYLVFFTHNGASGGSALTISTFLLLSLAGLFTTLPLLWFAMGAKRIPLSMIGFLQFIAPTLTLFIGVFFFHESFTFIHAACFFFIWSGLFLYSLSFTRWGKRVRNS